MHAQSREIDSLKTLLPTASDTNRINLLNRIGKQYWSFNTDTTRRYARLALDEAEKVHYRKGKAEALRIVGWSYSLEGNYTQAYAHLSEAIRLFEQLKYQPGLAAALDNLGNLLSSHGSYQPAREAWWRSLQIFTRLKDDRAVGSVLNDVGINYQQEGNYEKGIEYCLKGLAVRKRIGDKEGVVYSLIQMGNMYLAGEKPETALGYFQQSLDYAEAAGMKPFTYSLCQMGNAHLQTGNNDESLRYLEQALRTDHDEAVRLLGEVYLAQGKYTKALDCFQRVLSVKGKQQHPKELAIVLNSISKTYGGMKKYSLALACAHRSFVLARHINARKEVRDATKLLSEMYARQKDYQHAHEYQSLYIATKDSITSEAYARRLAMLEANLNVEKKEARIASLTREKQLQHIELQRQTLIRNVSVMVLGLTLVLGIVILRSINLKRKAAQLTKERLESDLKLERVEKEQKEAAYQSRTAELEMQALRAQMNPHFIFNCLNAINRFIMKNEPEAASDYLSRFSRLIRLILQNSHTPTVTLENELEALRLYLEMEALRFEEKFTFRIYCQEVVDAEYTRIPPLIIQPYVENAIWHGLMHKEGTGHITIRVQQENEVLTCTIEDDGIGRKRATELKSKSAMKSKSLGMQITAHRLALINALYGKKTTVEVMDLIDASGEAGGTRVVLRIPVE